MIQHSDVQSPLLTKREAAKYLRLSLSTLEKYRRTGSIPSVKLGHSVRFDRRQLDRIISEGL